MPNFWYDRDDKIDVAYRASQDELYKIVRELWDLRQQSGDAWYVELRPDMASRIRDALGDYKEEAVT